MTADTPGSAPSPRLRPQLPNRRVTIAAAVVALAGSAAGLTATASTTTASWSTTSTKALKLASATSLGKPAAAQPLRLAVGLALQNKAALDKLIAAQATKGSPSYHQFLTPAAFAARFAPSSDDANAVAAYLRSAGMKNVTVAANRLQVTADATAAQAESAFNTTLGLFRQSGKTVLANTTAAQVPSALSSTVSSVLGLSTLGMTVHPQASTLPNLSGFTPSQLATAYGASTLPSATGTSIAVLAEGDLSGTVTDLRNAEAQNGLPQVPLSIVPTGPASTDTSGADEWDLDTQTSTGVANNVQHLYLYDAPSLSDADIATELNTLAAQDVAKTASASFGECDLLADSGSVTADDAALAEAAAQGQTVFISSGDNGSACPLLPVNGIPAAGIPDTEYPASSPYAVAVGGTTLLAGDDGTYQNEIGWYAGGGGISPIEAAPSWQATANVAAKASSLGLKAGRGLPDIAMDGDPTTGALINVAGTTEAVGGTSLSAPLAMGAWARLENARGNAIGFAAPALYGLDGTAAGLPGSLTGTAPSGIRDVVLGVNGLYTAGPGYDFVTGLGSLDIAALVNEL